MTKIKMKSMFLLITGFFIAPILSFSTDNQQALIASSKETSKINGGVVESVLSVPEIYQMHIKTNISNRYAHTTVTSKVRNVAVTAQEAVFNLVLPNTAFISGFVMEVDGKNYTAYVKEKEEAKREYEKAVSSGQSAAHIAVSARNSNRFTVSVNVEPEKKAAFYLTYEQLLQRQDGHYEQVINIHPGQPVKDLSAEVTITENRKIIGLKVLPLRSGNEIETAKTELDPQAKIIINQSTATVKFHPNIERQKQLADAFGGNERNGLSGQFVVQYDIERDPYGGEVLVQDGYFVHFFAPTDLKPLPKQVVFVLDTSGSMAGEKIKQLKEAMVKILEQLNEQDSFNLVDFNSFTRIWDLNHPSSSQRYNRYEWDREIESFPKSYPANSDNIKKAKYVVDQMENGGSTNMYTALQIGLQLIRVVDIENNNLKRQPMIVFLTDGHSTDLSPEEIATKITEFNTRGKMASIFALSFGNSADKSFLQKLSLQNSGFSRHIYEAADASLQLQNFYREISSPLLSNVTFKYEPTVTSLTKTEFPIHFGGSEIVVAGWCGTKTPNSVVNGDGRNGTVSFEPIIVRSVSNVERLWAYLTISQLLEKKEASQEEGKELKKKALDLALRYKFVTPVSSLVVVKPNESSNIDTEEARHMDRYTYAANGALSLVLGNLWKMLPFYVIFWYV